MSRALHALHNRLSSFELPTKKSIESMASGRSSHDTTLQHTDPLPASPEALEGRLNHLASELQIMATRVDKINEFIDMETIVLSRLAKDEKEAAKKRADEQRARDEQQLRNMKTRRAKIWEEPERKYLVPKKSAGSMASLITDEGNGGVGPHVTMEMRNKQELIKEMKRLKKAMEKSVVWQRDEYWRVETAMGRKREPEVKMEGLEDEEMLMVGEHRMRHR